MDKVKIWNDFINELKNKVSDVTFNTWFINLKLLTINDKDIVIIVPYSVHKNHIINNYMDIIEEIFLNITGKNLNIVFCLEGEYKENTLDNIEKIGLDDSVIENFVEARKTNLNPKYTFDNFVVGDSNRFAFSSCLSVAQNPGKLYNPLFLYGKSGLGKTHLMHAIGNEILKNNNCNKKGIFHCCPFNVDLVREGLKLGFYISFAGPTTFKNSKNAPEIIKMVPLDKMLIETDSPYLSPEPFRGKRNDSRNVKYIAQKIAEVKQIPLEEVAKATYNNAEKIFGNKAI